ncbi:MAG: M13 family peptidase [Proteobacteria bacterium]|nr:M13 family peptidase [Pseudomonadota bacterium]MBS0463437.1 M13 family peptidase [Pseudomonadota bacterium]
MKRILAAAIGMSLLTGIAGAAAPLTSGIDTAGMDKSVRPQDNFYDYINGHWLATTQIPADKPSYGAFTVLYDKTQENLRTIVEQAQKSPQNAGERKIGDLYASYMDEARVDALGLKPLQPELDRIAAIKSTADLPALMAHLARIGVDGPFGGGVHQDNKDSTKYVIDFGQSGLGMPDRDYYLKDDLKAKRDAYQAHVERMLALAGDADAKVEAADVVALETELAKIQWTKVENRDPNKLYNKVMLADLPALMPGFDWKTYLADAGVAGKVDYVIVSQPSYFKALDGIIKNTPVATWRAYFRWQALHSAAPYLSKAFVDENFAFYGTAVRGVPQNRPRWQRGMSLISQALGEQLGQVYVARYFPASSKQRVTELVHNLLAAYKTSIDTLDWMSPETKKQAQAKLATYMLKLGYPDKWRDYSALTIDRNDLLGNLARASEFEYDREINKLGKPIDRSEWGMTPQTINAYYNPEMNEIVFPAAILQAPFFNPAADDAVNYGAIGAVIGHEISHGFDDEGSQYDGQGNLHDWWTKEDHEKFAAKTKALVAEYSAFEPVKGYHLNGELTLGENIADNSGLAIAYKAYLISLHGKPAPVIDGMTGPQRFYAGFAQVWRNKMREDAMIAQIKADPHSIPVDRVMGTVVNQPGFFKAYDVKPGDKMWVAPDKRVIIW